VAVLRQAEAERISRDAIVLDLGDLRRQGEQLRERSRADAAALLERAAIERARLLAGGRDEGYAVGLAAGREAGFAAGRAEGEAAALAARREALAALEASWGAALEAFAGAREVMLREARTDVVRLAAGVAELVTKRAVRLDASVVTAQLEAVLGLVLRPTRLTIGVHPDDEPLARTALPALLARLAPEAHAELRTDDALSRGSCVASMPGGGRVDASIKTQLSRIAEALLPGGGPLALDGPPAAGREGEPS